MKKSKAFDKLKLKQETQGRCGMCFYYPSDLAGLEIAHIVPRFKVNTDNEFNAISICTRCHTIYDSVVISVLKSGYRKEDKWWKDQIKDESILQKKRDQNYKEALIQIESMRETKKAILIRNGIFSHLELDVLSHLFEINQQIKLLLMNNHSEPSNFLVKYNEAIEELNKKYSGFFCVKKEFHDLANPNRRTKLFGLEIQYHDRIHFKNLIDRNFVIQKSYQSELLGSLRNLITSSGQTPRGEFAQTDRVMLFYGDNEATNNFCDNLFKELEDVVTPFTRKTKS